MNSQKIANDFKGIDTKKVKSEGQIENTSENTNENKVQ